MKGFEIPLRRSELISPFGVGSISTNNEGLNIMTGALDRWYNGKQLDISEYIFHESRLEKILGVKEFRLPPDFRSSVGKINTGAQKNMDIKIPMSLFPTWFYCNRCKQMEKLHLADMDKKICKNCKRGYIVQVPFVVVCKHGHIDDFPWVEWVHESIDSSCTGPLKLISTGGATLTSMRVECTSCGEKRRLQGVTSNKGNKDESPLSSGVEKGKKYLCTGRKHWYGTNDTAHEACNEIPYVLLKNSNNVYYPNVISAIYLPGDYSEDMKKAVEYLKKEHVLHELKMLKSFIEERSDLAQFLKQKYKADLSEIDLNIIEKALLYVEEEENEVESEIEYEDIQLNLKFQEYCSLLENIDSEHLKITTEYDAIRDNHILKKYGIKKIHLVPKLRDTRVLYSFQRVLSEQRISKDTIKSGRELMFKEPYNPDNNWLPGYNIYGEGIFIEFDKEGLERWETENADLRKHFQLMISRYEQGVHNGIIPEKEISPRFVMLHTLAHLMISEMIFECGYSTSALRERLYISKNTGKEMNGLLIYTASGDSEGTMGGLVRLGQCGNLIPILNKALDKSQWCSSDPVCVDIGISSGQGIHSLNIAACHNCTYLPETSCEEFNMFLDRSLLIGTPEKKEIGFFANI